MTRFILGNVSPPPGKNRTYLLTRNRRTRKAGLALTDDAKTWTDEVIVRLRSDRNARGISLDPKGRYWVSVILVMRTEKMDSDAPLALACDAIQAALGINDAHFGTSPPIKFLDPKRRGVDLYISVTAIHSDEEFNARSQAILEQYAVALGWRLDE